MSNKANTFKTNRKSDPRTAGTKKKKRSNTFSMPKRNISFSREQLSDGAEKTLKILGLFLIVVALLFAISFGSYLFTWEADQSYISYSNGGWNTLFQTAKEVSLDGTDVPVVRNQLGKLGALLANQFIFEWFGVASFLFIFILFIVGYKLLYHHALFPVIKSVVYASIGILFISVTLGFFYDYFSNSPHILEGKFGFWTNQMLNAQIGKAGTGILLLFILLTFLILVFNADLRFSSSYKVIGSLDVEEEEQERKEREAQNMMSVKDIQSLNQTETLPPQERPENKIAEEKNAEEESDSTFEVNLPPTSPAKNEIKSPALEKPALEVEVSDEQAEPDIEITDIVEEKKATSNALVEKFGKFDPKLDLSSYQYPTLDLLDDHGVGKITINQEELEENKNKIVETLRNYKIEIKHIKATIGPTVTLYEIIPKPGVRISKIKNLEDDIALSLAALGIRIIAPMPGKGTIGIEVPNSKPQMVSMRSVLATEKFQNTDKDLPIALGRTISNEVYIADLSKMPHLLVAGATGQGKSVGINAIIASLLYKKHPAELKFVLVDPKKVELSLFKKIERHFLAKMPDEEEAIITDTKRVITTLNSLCIEMDQRYDLLKDAQVRNLKEYNNKFTSRKLNPNDGHKFLPYIVLIIDEFADLMMTAGKEVETPIARLAQLARAVGIHLIIATQRPSVNIITGVIKANFPARLAFRVLSKVDSRTILDSGGADQLIGRGDMLLATGSDLIRLQCAFVDTPEVDGVSEFIGEQRAYPTAYLLPEYEDESGGGSAPGEVDLDERDKLFEDAARLVVSHQQGSTSLIQRRLKLGYNRAGRIIDQLEAAGIVGPFEGSKAREVLYPDEYTLEQYLKTLEQDS